MGRSLDIDALRLLLGLSLGEAHGQDAVLHLRFDVLGLGALRKDQGASEFTIRTLADRVPSLVTLLVDLFLTRDGEAVAVDVHADVLLLQAGQVEDGGDCVGLWVLVEVHSGSKCSLAGLTPTLRQSRSWAETGGERIVEKTIELGEGDRKSVV